MTFSLVEIPNVVEFSAEYHKIPHEMFSFPPLDRTLIELHSFMHLVNDENGTKQALLFVENDEMEQVKDVFEWIKAKTLELKIPLVWRITFFNLRSLFNFLKVADANGF